MGPNLAYRLGSQTHDQDFVHQRSIANRQSLLRNTRLNDSRKVLAECQTAVQSIVVLLIAQSAPLFATWSQHFDFSTRHGSTKLLLRAGAVRWLGHAAQFPISLHHTCDYSFAWAETLTAADALALTL